MSQHTHPSQIPGEAYQLGEAYRLSMPTGVYRVEYKRADWYYFWYQVIFTLFAFAILVAVIIATLVLHLHLAAFAPIVILLLLFNISTLSLLARRKNRPLISPFLRNLRVYTYANGFICVKGTRVNAVRWEQIELVRYSALPQPAVTVVCKDNRKFTFNAALPHVDVLGQLLEHATSRKIG